jgi:hypothetical protein
MKESLLEPIKFFWLVLIVLTMIWYTFVTLYVAVRGVADIKEMLSKLKKDSEEN